MTILIMAATTSTEGLPPWAQVIVGIILLFGIATRQLVPGWLYTDRVKELEATQEENRRLVQLVFDTQSKTLPAMEAATRAVSEAMVELRVRQQGRK